MATIKTRIQQKRDIEANWKKAKNFIPLDGELIVYETDSTHSTPRFKVGNGVTKVNDLAFFDAKNIVTFGENSSGSGWGESVLSKTYKIGALTVGPLDNLEGLEAQAANADAKEFTFQVKNQGLILASKLYDLLGQLIDNGFNGGIIEIDGQFIPTTGLTRYSEGSVLSRKYFVTVTVDPNFSIEAIAEGTHPDNIYIGVAYGDRAAAFGDKPLALGENSFVAGNLSRTTIGGNAAFATGYLTSAEAVGAFAAGISTVASGSASHAEGYNTIASGEASHAQNNSTTASGKWASAQGNQSKATGDVSFATGSATEASGVNSYAGGARTIAKGYCSTAKGERTQALGEHSYAEGYYTKASGRFSHAGGRDSIASGDCCFAHGWNVEASGDYKTAFGLYTVAPDGNVGSFVCGNENNPSSGALFSVGMGGRRDAIDVFNNGTATLPQSTLDTIAARGDKAIPTVEWVNSKLTSSGGGLDIKTEDVAEKAEPYVDKIGLYAAVKDGETDRQTLLRAKLENDSWTIPIRGVDGSISCSIDFDGATWKGQAVPHSYLQRKNEEIYSKIYEINNKASDVELTANLLSSTVSEHTSTIAALTQSVDAKKITVHQLDANSTLELKPNVLYAFLKSGSSNTVTVGLQDKDTQTFTAFNAGTKDEIKMKFGVVIIPENTLGNSEAYPPSYYGVAAVDTTTLGVTTVSSKKFTVKKSDLETNTILAKTDGDGQFLVWELSF